MVDGRRTKRKQEGQDEGGGLRFLINQWMTFKICMWIIIGTSVYISSGCLIGLMIKTKEVEFNGEIMLITGYFFMYVCYAAVWQTLTWLEKLR